MTNKKTKRGMLIGLIGTVLVITTLFIPISTIFMALLTGLLIVPPVLVMASVLIEGVLIASDRLNRFPRSEKEAIVISASN